MSERQIITSQFVRIEQTPAGLGERIFARILDYVIMVVYISGLFYIVNNQWFNGNWLLLFFLFSIPVIFYSFLWEVFNNGQSPGKKAFGIRVVMRDGTTPSVGAYMIRWILLIVDTFMWAGVLCIIVNKENQRLGDLSAGTIVIKERNYRQIQVSLDEYDYLEDNYKPVFTQAENLSLEQVNTITETLSRYDSRRRQRVTALAAKVKEFLNVASSFDDETFLNKLIRDYQYYALQII